MPPAIRLDPATQAALNFGWVAAAVAAAYAAGLGLSWVLQRTKGRSSIVADIDVLTRRPVRAMLMVIAATTAVHHTTASVSAWRGWLDHFLLIAVMATNTWLVASLVLVAERRAISRFAHGAMDISEADRHRRKIRTQITMVRRLVVAVVVVFGVAAVLETFPEFSTVGKTLFASAGILSVVAGLAAQTSLGAVFAGIQIAFSDAIRVGDVVGLENESGRIEEITLTYVVVRLFDERRLVLPCTYFTKTPYQNWTRNATALLGTVELDVDFTVPLDAMRDELGRLLRADELWDGRVSVLQVTDAVDGAVRVRMLVSAANAGALFDLRCNVREGIVKWLQSAQPHALPRHRIERAEPAHRVDAAGRRFQSDASRANPAIFNDSPGADQRGHALPESEDRDGERPGGRQFASLSNGS